MAVDGILHEVNAKSRVPVADIADVDRVSAARHGVIGTKYEVAPGLTWVCPAWVIVKVCPPIVRVPLRSARVVLAETEYPTDPLPVPEDPDVMSIQEALLVAAQAADAVTLTVPVPPVAGAVAAVGLIVSDANAAAWLTVKVCPAIVILPTRAGPVLAATE